MTYFQPKTEGLLSQTLANEAVVVAADEVAADAAVVVVVVVDDDADVVVVVAAAEVAAAAVVEVVVVVSLDSLAFLGLHQLALLKLAKSRDSEEKVHSVLWTMLVKPELMSQVQQHVQQHVQRKHYLHHSVAIAVSH